MTEGSSRRVGWLLVAFGVIALGGFGAYAGNNTEGFEPGDSTWPLIAFMASPFIAAGSGVAIGVLLIVVAALGLVDVDARRAANAAGFGCIVAPVLYFITMMVLADFLESLEADAAWQLPWFIFALPIAIGIATVLGYALRSRGKLSQARRAAPPPG